ncbi:hypothetical protein N9602_06055 [Saprospiraceae bacterium]|nr:hypothetical protein [Saprospiraceae bacterium]MDB4163416.1 hypothetical protein [Saprospiraceae bacterium]MDB4824655.1 hypothetical protein [Saprospiraceae bacterium]
MSNVQHHKLKVSRTAQVFTYGNKESARLAVLVCLGYAHLKSISRSDVAKFILDAVTDSQWDGSPGVLLGGDKS